LNVFPDNRQQLRDAPGSLIRFPKVLTLYFAALGVLALFMTVCLFYRVSSALFFLGFTSGNVNWTEEGHRFSWRMKLRDKVGEARFFVTAKDTGDTRAADPATAGRSERESGR
jgi:hypothetical protein